MRKNERRTKKLKEIVADASAKCWHCVEIGETIAAEYFATKAATFAVALLTEKEKSHENQKA